MSHVRMWERRLAVEVERHVGFHDLDLRWASIFVIAAVVIGAAIEVAGAFVLIGTAMLRDWLATPNAERRGAGETNVVVAVDELGHRR